MNKHAAHIIAQLTAWGEDPDFHPGVRQILSEAAKLLVDLEVEIDELHQMDTDKG